MTGNWTDLALLLVPLVYLIAAALAGFAGAARRGNRKEGAGGRAHALLHSVACVPGQLRYATRGRVSIAGADLADGSIINKKERRHL